MTCHPAAGHLLHRRRTAARARAAQVVEVGRRLAVATTHPATPSAPSTTAPKPARTKPISTRFTGCACLRRRRCRSRRVIEGGSGGRAGAHRAHRPDPASVLPAFVRPGPSRSCRFDATGNPIRVLPTDPVTWDTGAGVHAYQSDTARVAAGRQPTVACGARPGHQVVWRAFWTSRLVVLLSGMFAVLQFGLAAGSNGFDPPGLTAPFGYFGNVVAAPFARWDSVWYLQIARFGYRHQLGRTAFFPLYPGLIHVVGAVTRLGPGRGRPDLARLFRGRTVPAPPAGVARRESRDRRDHCAAGRLLSDVVLLLGDLHRIAVPGAVGGLHPAGAPRALVGCRGARRARGRLTQWRGPADGARRDPLLLRPARRPRRAGDSLGGRGELPATGAAAAVSPLAGGAMAGADPRWARRLPDLPRRLRRAAPSLRSTPRKYGFTVRPRRSPVPGTGP